MEQKILRIIEKKIQDGELPHESFVKPKQKSKVRNVFTINMSTVTKLSQAQTSKIIQSGGSFGSWLGNLGKKALANVTIPFTRYNLPALVTDITSNVITKFERIISQKGVVRAGKGVTLFTSNEDLNNIV